MIQRKTSLCFPLEVRFPNGKEREVFKEWRKFYEFTSEAEKQNVVGIFFDVYTCSITATPITGNTRMLARSAIGAVVSGIMYAAITCGEEIVSLIVAWSAA